MSRRLVILTELIAPYRIPVFNALAARPGIDLHVIFLSKTDSSQRQWRIYEEEIRFSYEVLPSLRRRIGRFNFLLNSNVFRALRQADPEVLICGGYSYLASWQAMKWAKRNHVPLLLWCESTAQDARNQYSPVEWLKKQFLGNCDAFLVPGAAAKSYIQRFASPSQRIFIARNAVDIDLFAAKETITREIANQLRRQLLLPARYFLFVGRLVEPKGVLDLIKAYGSLGPELRSSVGLVVAGEGPLRGKLEVLTRAICPGKVRLPGFIQRDELANYYALAECLVMPTHSDPWGLVVNEAMACGLPVICTNVAGCAADLVRENGIMVPPGNIRKLADAMRIIASDGQLRHHMSTASAKLIQEYSPEACAAGFADATVSSMERLDA